MLTRSRFLLAALAFLVGLVAAPAYLSGLRVYSAGSGPQARPHPHPGSPGITPGLKRGEYLVEDVVTCFRCHSERDWNAPGAPVVKGKKGAGYFFVKGAGPVNPQKPPALIAPNITPDPETGVGKWSDAVLARAIRECVAPDGQPFPCSFHAGSHNLSDEDLASVVAYLRTIPAVPNTMADANLSRAKAANPPPPVPPRSVPPPDLSDPVRRGEYLATLADCVSCHTTDVAKAPLHDQQFAGGKLMSDNPAHYVMTPNITMDPSGIGYYDQAMFIRVLRSGKVGARKLYPIMPWGYFRKMSDQDLKAIFAYLKTLPHVQHIVDNTEPPTFCRRCLQRHGGGDRN